MKRKKREEQRPGAGSPASIIDRAWRPGAPGFARSVSWGGRLGLGQMGRAWQKGLWPVWLHDAPA
jgi:hypothetical protein